MREITGDFVIVNDYRGAASSVTTTNRKKRVLIVHEAMGGCGRNIIDIANGIDRNKFEPTESTTIIAKPFLRCRSMRRLFPSLN